MGLEDYKTLCKYQDKHKNHEEKLLILHQLKGLNTKKCMAHKLDNKIKSHDATQAYWKCTLC